MQHLTVTIGAQHFACNSLAIKRSRVCGASEASIVFGSKALIVSRRSLLFYDIHSVDAISHRNDNQLVTRILTLAIGLCTSGDIRIGFEQRNTVRTRIHEVDVVLRSVS